MPCYRAMSLHCSWVSYDEGNLHAIMCASCPGPGTGLGMAAFHISGHDRVRLQQPVFVIDHTTSSPGQRCGRQRYLPLSYPTLCTP